MKLFDPGRVTREIRRMPNEEEISQIKEACRKKFEEELVQVRKNRLPIIYPKFSHIIPGINDISTERRAIWVKELTHLVNVQSSVNKNVGPELPNRKPLPREVLRPWHSARQQNKKVQDSQTHDAPPDQSNSDKISNSQLS